MTEATESESSETSVLLPDVAELHVSSSSNRTSAADGQTLSNVTAPEMSSLHHRTRRIRNKWYRCLHVFAIYIVYIILLLLHLTCFSLNVIFYSWCLYNDRTSIVKCSNFKMYENPMVADIVWAASKIPIGVLATIWITKTDTYGGLRYVWKTLKVMPRFWSMFSLLLISCTYSISEIATGLQTQRSPSLPFFVFELFEKVVLCPLPCLLNCTKPPREYLFNIEYYLYIATLVMFAADNMFETVASTLLSAFKLATIPNIESYHSILINLVLMIANAAYRKVLWDFYWLKLWKGDRNLFATIYPSLPRTSINS